MTHFRWLAISLISIAACGAPPDQVGEKERSPKAPRPVLVRQLQGMHPRHVVEMTGSVVSWKTEQIGFEVAGRVLKVLEPQEEIEGRILRRLEGRVKSAGAVDDDSVDADPVQDGAPDEGGSADQSTPDDVIREGTVLAQLDDERYRIAVQSAEVAIDVATRKMEVTKTELTERIPVRIDAAAAEQEFAQGEFDRFDKLAETKAVSRSQLDQARTNLKIATANAKALLAERAAKQAELESLKAQVKQAEQQLKDARLDLRNTKLYSSFRGQVAQAHVVPGSYVDKGESVITVQMMDPIKVELELSAAMSRQFRYGDTVRLYAANGGAERVPLEGFIYMTDPVADPQTRTFTFTLLVRNRPIRQSVPPEFAGESLPRTFDVWPLRAIGEMIGGDGELQFVEEGAIRYDQGRAFLWKVTNRHIGEISVDSSRVLEVEKVRITEGALKVPFLGNWNFVPITFDDESALDPERDMVVGRLIVPEGEPDDWNGDRVLFDRKGWLLQPGDLVRVDLSRGNEASGTYVPLRAIHHEFGKTYVFIVDDTDPEMLRARRLQVQLADVSYAQQGDDRPEQSEGRSDQGPETLVRIEPVGGITLDAEARLIVEGAHYLVDGEPIVVVERSEVAR